MHSVIVDVWFYMSFRVILTLLSSLEGIWSVNCGLALVSPSLYMYYLILKEKIPKYKEARFDIPSHDITHLA